MATSTLAQIYATLVDRYALGRRGTNTGVLATSLASDDELGGPDAARGLDFGCQVLIDAGTRAGDIRNLATKPALRTGLAAVDPSFGGVLSATSTFIILYKPLRFVGGGYALRDKINQAQAEFQWEVRRRPISLVPDADMISTGVADWTVSSGTATKTAAAFALPVRYISLAVGNGYIQTATIPVEPDSSYFLEVLAFRYAATASNGTISLRDITNSTTISLSDTTVDRLDPQLFRESFTTPSTCHQVAVRVTNGATAGIGIGHVILRKNSAREFTIADTPQKALWLGRLLTPSLNAWGQRGEWEEIPSTLMALDAGLWRYQADQSLSGLSVWYEETVKPATLTAVTDTTQLPVEDLAAVAAEALLRPLRTWSKEWNVKYEYAASRSAGVIGRYLEQNWTVVNQAPAVYPLARV